MYSISNGFVQAYFTERIWMDALMKEQIVAACELPGGPKKLLHLECCCGKYMGYFATKIALACVLKAT